jgi:hypothetical protein
MRGTGRPQVIGCAASLLRFRAVHDLQLLTLIILGRKYYREARHG